jgi:hypothetical protein
MNKLRHWTVPFGCLPLGISPLGNAGCSSNEDDTAQGSGGTTSTGGQASGTGGQAPGTGGLTSTGGTSPTGGSSSGGTVSTGGTVTGGVGTGGASAKGGSGPSGNGGAATGGAARGGGSSSGGATKGGASGSGGTSKGGAASGGASGGVGGAAAGGSAGKTGTGGSAGGTCQSVQLKGSDICTIGDSWIQIPGNQVTTLQTHMRTAGSIGASESFDRREASGTTLDTITASYDRNTKCKILIMDGGGIDLFSTPLGPESPAVTNVVTKFENFLAKVKTDGNVEHIIYSLYPKIPNTANLNANMKPGFSAACAASEVHCILVDLEPLFMGQHFASDRTHADNAGGVIIGDAWWKAMKENCIGQ